MFSSHLIERPFSPKGEGGLAKRGRMRGYDLKYNSLQPLTRQTSSAALSHRERVRTSHHNYPSFDFRIERLTLLRIGHYRSGDQHVAAIGCY